MNSSILSTLLLGTVLVTSGIATAAAQPVRPAALRAQAAELERKATELKQAGQHDEARMLMRQVEELRSEFNRRRAEDDDQRRQPRGPREEADQRPNPGEIERRAHHLEIAIDNLHAAGLHEPAEHLAPQLERMRRHLAEMTPGRPGQPELPGNVIEDLQAQIGELHRIVRQLRAEIEEVRRERR